MNLYIKIAVIIIITLVSLALGFIIILLYIDESLRGCTFGAPIPASGPIPDLHVVQQKAQFTIFSYLSYFTIVAGCCIVSLRSILSKKYFMCTAVIMLLITLSAAYPILLHAIKKALFGVY